MFEFFVCLVPCKESKWCLEFVIAWKTHRNSWKFMLHSGTFNNFTSKEMLCLFFLLTLFINTLHNGMNTGKKPSDHPSPKHNNNNTQSADQSTTFSVTSLATDWIYSLDNTRQIYKWTAEILRIVRWKFWRSESVTQFKASANIISGAQNSIDKNGIWMGEECEEQGT